MNVPQYIVVHHTGGTDADPLANTSHHTVETVNNHHKTLWSRFISRLGWHVGYHYFINKKGEVTQTRYDNEEGAHVRGMNRKSIGICLAGNFDSTEPTREQTEALRLLLKRLSKKYAIPKDKIVPHRRFANKTCYGRRLSDDWASDLLEGEKRTSLSEYTIKELFGELNRRVALMRKGK